LKIAIAGGGPAGLYFALLMKKAWPGYSVTIFEQNTQDATYGFGVVFSDTALTHLEDADTEFFAHLSDAAEHWDDLTITHKGTQVPIDGNGFSGISRLALLKILYRACLDAGVHIRFGETIDVTEAMEEVDLVVGADGANSSVRTALATSFQPQICELTNHFVWYGTRKPFNTLSLTFQAHDGGAYVAHHYCYAPEMSTFIVECDAATFTHSGLSGKDDARSRAFCENIFSETLGGAKLISNRSIWRRFPEITNRNWTAGHAVLLGDALRTIHFSIGSGTRLAMEDAVALYRAFQKNGADVDSALGAFVTARKPHVDKLLYAARSSYEWYEKFAGKMTLPPIDLAYDYMTRSGRMPEERLHKIAPKFHARWRVEQAKNTL
jgi:2-polyprenyl-6-methoxyphenol hydroxylase-like FAD-dependent oxidoreductase